jgi:hypothetical protein
MKVDRQVARALDETGLPWEVISGKKHLKIMVNNRLVGILPHGTNSGGPRAIKNCLSNIRRASEGSYSNSRRAPGVDGD